MQPFQSSAGKTERQPDGQLAFIPNTIPPDLPALDDHAQALLSATAEAIGRLDGYARRLPNLDLFVGMYVRKEALLSSQIENIDCTLDEVLQIEENVDADAGVDVRDVAAVVNYVKAVNRGFERLERGESTSLEMLRELHRILLTGTRDGESATPGEFRDTQNWIGRPGSTMATATFVPPPVDAMHARLVNLEYYLRDFQGHSPVVRCAIAHAQFETIHPFDNGNGRVGRMLIVLLMRQLGALQQPLLYPSLFLKDNRNEYYDRLMAIRVKGEWAPWIEFFATGIRHTATEALEMCEKIVALKAESESAQALPKNTRRTLELMFTHPILDANAAKRHLGVGFDAAAGALKRLEADGWIEEITGKRRGRTYRFSRYIRLLEGAGENEPGLRTDLSASR